MKKYIFVEIVCLILTAVFIVSSIDGDRKTLKTAKEITDDIVHLLEDDSLIEREKPLIKDTFDMDLSDFSSVSYYSSDDIMDVTEIFVGVLKSDFKEETKNAFITYVENEYNLFNGYAPDQAAYIDAYILNESSGAVCFCVAENRDAIYEAFLNAVE